MKICVFSDSHGYADNMIQAITRESPALCFFLGDGERDLAAVHERFPSLGINAVRGNCDLRSSLPQSLICAVQGVRFFATHGHLYNVKYDPALQELFDAAGDAAVALFGHTHRPYLKRREGMLLLNPGTAGKVPRASYALLTLCGETVQAEIKYF